jgi:CRISPR-associated protein Csd2
VTRSGCLQQRTFGTTPAELNCQSAILAAANPDELKELIASLMEFKISTQQIVTPGRNKSSIATSMDTLLQPLGWYESRILGDLIVKKRTVMPNPGYT